MEASNRRSCGVSFILVDTAIIVKERLNRAQCLTIQPPMLKHSQGQVPGYIPQQTGYYVTGVATCYLNLLVISSCCFDTNSEMFLMIHLYQIAQLTKNGHYIFKQLSESVAQIMSQKMFLKTP